MEDNFSASFIYFYILIAEKNFLVIPFGYNFSASFE